MNDREQQPTYLSVVATSRNDDHGGDPLIRTQIFINNLARQCEKYSLPAELIIVDWNPVPDRPGLAEALVMPSEATYLQSRIITVPEFLHSRIKYSEKLSLFQMISKNVGIRRAAGEFVLVTNIDILFSDELVQYLAKKKLDKRRQYRVDRYDIKNNLSQDLSLDETLEYAWTNPIRQHRRYEPKAFINHAYESEPLVRMCAPDLEYCNAIENIEVIQADGVHQLHISRDVDMRYLHTNACGDFALMAKEAWCEMRGYPEFEAFSMNIDSVGMVAAHYAGYREITLLPPCVCFHIEHEIGSGWTPEGEKKLYKRLRESEILNPEWHVLEPLIDKMKVNEGPVKFNYEGWGMDGMELPERPIGSNEILETCIMDNLHKVSQNRKIAAIKPDYDLDRLSLNCERRMYARMGITIGHSSQRVQVYIPDPSGRHTEGNSIEFDLADRRESSITFKLDDYPVQHPIRLDPCEARGDILIDEILACDVNNVILWSVNKKNLNKIAIAGTAALKGNGAAQSTRQRNNDVLAVNTFLLSQRGVIKKLKENIPLSLKQTIKDILVGRNTIAQSDKIHIVSSGTDPQIYLPAMPQNVKFPIFLTVSLQFMPEQVSENTMEQKND